MSRLRDKMNSAYFKQKKHQQRQMKRCDHVNTTLIFQQDDHRDLWQLYNCPVLLNFRREKEANTSGLQHAKCSSFARGRLAAERWCAHLSEGEGVRRVFASRSDERMWNSKQCALLPSPVHSDHHLLGMNKDARNAFIMARKKKTLSTLKEKYNQDKWCFHVQQQHVAATKSSGNNSSDVAAGLSPRDKIKWISSKCAAVLPTYVRDYQICSPLDSNRDSSSEGGSKSGESLPLIAIMASTTSRGYNLTTTPSNSHPSFTKISLFKTLLPSLLCTLDCGFNYLFVLGYDQGDEFYDSPAHLLQVQAWFTSHIATPLQEEGLVITLHTVVVENPLRRPGPAFIAIAQAAYRLGADYFYRVNDDSQFLGKWAALYTRTLQHLTPPHVGVIGPSCFDSNDRILTHDFVHRTHMDIFEGLYYPTEFSDWFMDDWISAVYGPKRTFLSKKVGIDHHNRFRERTYVVNRSNVKLLPPLIQKGQQKIMQWMQRQRKEKQGVPDGVLEEFEEDVAGARNGEQKGLDGDISKYQELY